VIPPTLSPEQQAVVCATDPRFTVVASAGAGKTFVLVERYLRHVVEEGIKPDEILTITFTKKAAAEMKRRIVSRLRDRGLNHEAQVAETGPIQTIHSFCERLLRENSLEAGLDPSFDITTESQSTRLVSKCVREVLASRLEDEPQAEDLITFLAGKRQGFGENKSPYGILEMAVESALRELRGSGYRREEIAPWYQSPRALRDKWEDVLLRNVSDDARRDYQHLEGGSFHERLQKAVKSAGERMPIWLKAKPEADAEEEALLHTCGLVQLACAAWWRLDREMNADQALDFTALEERAVRLLERSSATCERLSRQIKVVMVDEAQDLNPMQYRLLQRLGARQEMLVGDAQQSIYGFRQADVEHFDRRQKQEKVLPLSRNYRSEAGVLEFVDFVFGGLWAPTYKPMSDVGAPMDLDAVGSRQFAGVEIWKQAANDSDATATYIKELIEEGILKKDIAVLVRDGGGAQAMEVGLKGVGIPCRVAGGTERFYTRLEVRDLSNALRAVADPYDDFSLLAALRSPLVGLSMDSIMLLGQAPDVVERLETFEPPIPEDVERLEAFLVWFKPLRAVADRLSAWEVLSEIFAKSDFLSALARREQPDQVLANVRKLLSLATQEPELGPLEYAERIREIQDLRHKEGDAPADEENADLVTIMTIHKAKGLEYPVVVLPQTDKRLTGNARELVAEPRWGMIATKFGKGQCLMHKFLTERKKQRDEAEELRVLYVALTRAKSRLCVCLYPPRRDRTVSKMLMDLLGDPPPPGIHVRNSQDASLSA